MKINKFLVVKHTILFILLVLLSIFLLVGLTYFFSVSSYYKNFMNFNHSFRVLYLTLDDDIDRKKLIKDLELNKHVEDAFLYDEYLSFGIIDDYKNDIFTGEVNIIGVNPGMQKIIAGEDLNDKEDGIICPSDFYPEIFHSENPYNYNDNINIINDVNKDLKIKYANIIDTEIKLIGVFDRSYDYTDPNVCYTTHKTLRKLNDITFKKTEEDINDIFVLIDDLENINELYKYSGIIDITPVTKIRSENITNIISTVGFAGSIFVVFIIIICYLFNNRQIINNYRNIGINRIVGYSKKSIKKKYYLENSIIIILSIFLSILVSQIILVNFTRMFLYNKPQLSMMSMSLSMSTVVICFLIISFSIYSSTFISLKKIDEMDICEIVNE